MRAEFVIPKHSGRAVLGEAACNAAGIDTEVLEDLNSHDALFITEDDTYERCEALARGFVQLAPAERSQTVDTLAANLRLVCSSAHQLLTDGDETSNEALQQHRKALKMLVHLLHIISGQAHKEAEQTKGTENATKPVKASGRGRKAAADSRTEWDWQLSRQQVLLAVRDVMRVDLKALFKGLSAAERMVNLCMEMALQALDAPTVGKQADSWAACCDVLIRGAVLHEQLDFVAAALMEKARKHEHVPPLAAQAAKYAEEKYNSTQLAVKLLAEFWSQSPDDYDSQHTTNPKSVRQAGEVVALLAELLPKVVSNHISQLRPYLACSKASSIRGTLITATGSILLRVFPTDALSSSLGAGAAQAHLRSKEALLALLHARVLDKAAYVRQRVLQTWALLVEESCVPLSHWNTLLAQAIGRLEDDSQLVVKAALQLLTKMLHQGIFQPPLNAQVYINTLRQAEAQLEAVLPAGQRQQGAKIGEGRSSGQGGDDGADSDEGDEEGAEAGGDDDDGAAWEQGDIKVDDAAAEAAMDIDEGATAGGDSSSSSAAKSAADITRLRTMIASLKEGASFCKRLTACLSQVQVLLNSPAAGVVHDTIIFLTTCKTLEVSGAAKVLRSMWPLVFSKVEAVKEAVLDSWNILHLHGKTHKEQLAELVQNVLPGCSLAELTALEAILAALVQQGTLSAPLLVHLSVQELCHHYTRHQELLQEEKERGRQQRQGCQDSAGHQDQHSCEPSSKDSAELPAGAAPGAACDGAGGAGPVRSDYVTQLRHVFTLLSLLAAAAPSAVKPKYVPVLLEVGFSQDLVDAWVARHTCMVLHHAAPHLVPHAQLPGSSPTTANSSCTSDAVPPETHQAMLASLVRLLVGPPAAALAPNWPSAAEAAVSAVYSLSPQPQQLMAAVLEEMFRRARVGNTAPAGVAGAGGAQQEPLPGFSAAALARFFFVLGRTAVQHLLCIEQLGKAIRQARLTASRAAAEAAEKARESGAAGGSGARGGAAGRKAAAAAAKAAAAAAGAPQDDIGGMLGAGAVTADSEVDDLVERVEAQILAKDQLLGAYGALLSRLVHLRALITYPAELQASALLALTQLMAVDGGYCSDNVAVLFTLLHKRLVSAPVRVNMVVALADLASRWPNVLEPWTAYMYESLSDPEPCVKLAALSCLTHLVLGGMVKAKGNVAKVAMLLVDDCPELVDRAVLFFESLAASGTGSARAASSAAAGASAVNPVYNLLPDCLSALLSKNDPPLQEEQMQVIMTQLLAYVKDKQAESLRERLVLRLQSGGPREWRLVAWCIGQLGYSEKGLRRIMELTACYRHTLGQQQVYDVFMNMARKATGSKAAVAAAAAGTAGSSSAPSGLPGDFKSSVEDWVADLAAAREAALEAAEVEAATHAAQPPPQQQQQEAADGQPQEPPPGTQQPQEEDTLQAPGSPSAAAQQVEAQEAAAGPEAGCSAMECSDHQTGGGSPGGWQQQGEGQQLELVASQDIATQDELEPALRDAAAAAVAAEGVQRMSLAGAWRVAASGGAAAAADGAAGGRRRGTGAAHPKLQHTAGRAADGARSGGAGKNSSRASRKARATQLPSSSSDGGETSDAESDTDSDVSSAAGGRGAAVRAAGAAAKAGASGRSRIAHSRQQNSARRQAASERATSTAALDSSSEDDD